MQDRNLFRGKQLFDSGNIGEWLVGNFITSNCGKTFIVHNWEYGQNLNIRANEVDPVTVGQCTGLHAAKSYRGESEADRSIFEHDILQWKRADIKNPEVLRGTVKWRSDQWHVIYDFECDRYWVLSAVVDRGCEIIGNIHDQTEDIATE